MKPIFTVDGRHYNVSVAVGGLKRSAKVLDGKNAGRVQSGRLNRDIIGTYYNYAMQIETEHMDVAEYDALYEVLSAPVDYHNIVITYGQGTLAFEAYISNVDDALQLVHGTTNLWGGLAFTFTAMEPKRRP